MNLTGHAKAMQLYRGYNPQYRHVLKYLLLNPGSPSAVVPRWRGCQAYTYAMLGRFVRDGLLRRTRNPPSRTWIYYPGPLFDEEYE